LLDIIAENIGIYNDKNLKEVLPSIKRPAVKLASTSASMWMKKHGLGTDKKKRVDDIIVPEHKTQFSVKVAEEINDEKILQMLFKLKNNANQFIDEFGEVNNNINNTWDIKANLNVNEEYSPTPKFKEFRYLTSLQEKKYFNNSFGPFNRNVKLFRENFLFKKFKN
jgi:hypothetical protein